MMMPRQNHGKHTNRLSQEKSPYLLQHAHNPVDWHPWGTDAFDRALREDKPIFLSIGYSTCHWCHVMERESFEDTEVAGILGRHFISIKVDREERPDIDHIYMTVCQTLTGRGGWPLTIFMTPEKKPFYAGTYFPKYDRMGMPGIVTLLTKVSDIWKKDKSSLLTSSEKIMDALSQHHDFYKAIDVNGIVHNAYADFTEDFDNLYGGFGNAPKFPSPHNLYFLLRYWHSTKEHKALDMVEKTLESMHNGGIYDHIGFGFSRYSTDREWLIPHFEKMLYDNALLAIAYLEAYQATRKDEYANVARQIFTYILRDMTSPDGGFYSAEDADSEGVEGKYYIWTEDEIKEVLGGPDAEKFCRYYDITSIGNFEGANIPNRIRTNIPENERGFADICRARLFDYREKRMHPFKDDKILTSWNGLMIAAMAIGGRVLDNGEYTLAAQKALDFIVSRLTRPDGRLLARYRDGESAFPAYLDDYAFLVWGLIELYETTFKPEYLQRALNLNEDLLKFFHDKKSGGLFTYGSDGEQLIIRPKELYDGALPSGNSVATLNFLRLARLTGRNELEELAQSQFNAFGSVIEQSPRGYAFMLSAILFASSPTREIIVASGADQRGEDKMIGIIRESFRPFTVSVLYSDEHSDIIKTIPFVEHYTPVNGKATAYICENFTCSYPVTSTNEFRKMVQ
jgi:uncharacterized protein YyaL (SSP411 family)